MNIRRYNRSSSNAGLRSGRSIDLDSSVGGRSQRPARYRNRNRTGSSKVRSCSLEDDRALATVHSQVLQDVSQILADVPDNTLSQVSLVTTYENKFGRYLTTRIIKSMWPSVSYYRNKTGMALVSLSDWAARDLESRLQAQEDADDEESVVEAISTRRVRTNSMCSSICGIRIPRAYIKLSVLATRVEDLMETLRGSTSLHKFIDFYASKYGELDYESTDSVPLEHLISCIAGIKIHWSSEPIRFAEKMISLVDSGNFIQKFGVNLKAAQASKSQLLIQFGREAKEIIMERKGSVIPYNRFVPAYYRHYGRQRHVARLGFDSLAELFDAVSDVIQVVGEGDDRLITPTHGAQIKRFAAVLLKILRNHPNRSVHISDLDQLHEEIIGKPFYLADYGVCDIDDLLCQMWPGTISITDGGSGSKDRILSLPRPQRTSEEVARTRQFKVELIDLLRCTSTFSLPLSKLVPAYHHHFNRQCRVSSYGFSKLIDLLQSLVPHVIQLIPYGPEKKIPLVPGHVYRHNGMCSTSAMTGGSNGSDNLLIVMSGRERSFALSRRLERIVRLNHAPLTTECLSRLYESYYGAELIPEEWGVASIEELLDILPNRRLTAVKVTPTGSSMVHLTRSLQARKEFKPIYILKKGQPLPEEFRYKPADNPCHRYALPKLSPSIVVLARMPHPPKEWLDKIDEVSSGASDTNDDLEEVVAPHEEENGYWTGLDDDTTSVSTDPSFRLDRPLDERKRQEAISKWTRTGRLI